MFNLFLVGFVQIKPWHTENPISYVNLYGIGLIQLVTLPMSNPLQHNLSMKQKKKGKVIWTKLSDEEARRQFGASFTIVGRPITGSDAKTKPVNEVNTEKPKGLDG